MIFRIGESYFNELPSSIDRDMTPGTKAIDAYRELAVLYPKSEFQGDAQKHLNECTERLSEKERYIADFYYKRDMYDSAARRYEKITAKFAGTKVDQYSYWRWSNSLLLQSEQPEFADQKVSLTSEAKHVLRTYLARYPQGDYSDDAKHRLEKMGEH